MLAERVAEVVVVLVAFAPIGCAKERATTQVVQEPTCPDGLRRWPVPGRAAVCVSGEYAEFLACTAEEGLSEVETGKAAQESTGGGIEGSSGGVTAGASVQSEASAAASLAAKYADKPKIRSCHDDFRQRRGLPPFPTEEDNFDTLPEPATPRAGATGEESR